MSQNSFPPSVPDISFKSPLRYPGGKTRVAKHFDPYSPPHGDYREPFAGGAGVFFHKPLVQTNWLNDLHPGLYALWVALRDHFDAFAELCREQGPVGTRERFDYWAFERRDLMELRADESLLERGLQYFYLNRTVWAGRVIYDPNRQSRLYYSNPPGWSNLDKKLAHLRQISNKLQGVKITNADYAPCLADATADTFIYADPPYLRDAMCHATDKLYDVSFDRADHQRLADALHQTPAKVMISYDDCPEARQLYAGWHFVGLSWKYSGTYAVTDEAKAKGVKETKVSGNELLVLNYEPPASATGHDVCQD